VKIKKYQLYGSDSEIIEANQIHERKIFL